MATTKSTPVEMQNFREIQNPQSFKDVLEIYNEEPKHKRMVIMPCTLEAMKTKGGIIIPDSDMTHAFNNEGKHGHQQMKSMYDSEVAIVIKCSKKCEEGCKPGDVIRFTPMSAHKFKFDRFELLLIHEVDLQVVCGTIDMNKKK
jgi:co-chaperonin GroES (HSP10)